MPHRALIALIVFASSQLAGCDMLSGALGIESPEKVAAARDADGKAIGGACRHAGRAIEDCYALNKRADKAAVFAGWRDMNDYMRENKIDPVSPQMSPQPTARVAGAKGAMAEAEAESGSVGDKPAAEGQAATRRAKPHAS